MQETSMLLKSLHELEFLFAYHKHILTVNKCDCDNFMHNLKEFYRVYLNMKSLSVFLRKEICKIYNENQKLKKQNAKLNEKLSENRSGKMTSASSKNIYDDLGKKFYKLEKLDSLIDTTAEKNQPIRKSFSQQNLNQESLLRPDKVSLFRTTPATTTIGQTIEEAESKLAIRKSIMNSQPTKVNIVSSSCSSFSSSSYYSHVPTGNIFTAVPNHRRDYENHDFDNYHRKKPIDYTKRFSSIEIGSNNSPISNSSSSLLNSSRSCNQNTYNKQNQAKFYQSFDNLSYENSFHISKIPSHVYLNKVHDTII